MAPPVAPALAKAISPPSPVSEMAPGGRIWRVAAAVASGFFHATTEEGAAPAGVSPSPSSASSPSSSSAAAAAFFAADAADFPDFVDELVDLICRFTPHDDRPDLLRLLRLLDTKVGTLLVAGRGGKRGSGGRSVSPPQREDKNNRKQQKQRLPFLPRRFPDFSPEERETVLLRWMKSKGPLGQAARGLKSLVFLALFRFVEEEEEEEREGAAAPSSSQLPLSSPSPSSTLAAVSSLSATRKKKNPFWDACSYSSPASAASSPVAAATVSVSLAKVATEATLLARTVDASRLPSAAEAAARFSALGFAPVVSSSAAASAAVEQEGENVITLSADAVVVGSGAGGGVAAALLAASGLRVVVLEKGRYSAVAQSSSSSSSSPRSSSENSDNFEPLDLSERAFSNTYERGTLCSSRDLSATALAGSTLGGGTRINWCASFPTPGHVRAEWSRVGGLPTGLAGNKQQQEQGEEEALSRFDRALAAVCSRMRVSVNVGGVGGGGGGGSPNSAAPASCSSSLPFPPHNGPNSRLAEGLAALGEHAGRVPRNCCAASFASASASAASADCGRCCFSGCPSGDKQDHTHTFLADAARAGALVLTGTMAERVLLERRTRKRPGKEKIRAEEEGAVGGGGGKQRKFAAAGVEAAPLPAGSPLPFEKQKRGGGSGKQQQQQHQPAFRLVVRAPIVVAAAGSLHTPALLLRSGLRNRNIGRGLRLHPSLVVLGRFPEKNEGGGREEQEEGAAAGKSCCGGDIEDAALGSVRMDRGPIMSAFGKGGADWEGSGYGPLLMTPSLHLAGFAATVPWSGSSGFKRLLASYGDWSPVLVLTRDGACGGGGFKKRGGGGGGGRVTLDSQGQPRFDYRPSRADARAMAKGAASAVAALAAAGAVEIGSFLRTPFLTLPPPPPPPPPPPTTTTTTTTAEGERGESREEEENKRKLAVKRYRRHVESIFGPRAIRRRGGSGATVISAHQMGTARAGPTPKTGAVEGATGESWEASGLFVADASLFPTASGVNPMVSVCALSWMVSEGICEQAVGKKRAAAGALAVLARGGTGGGGAGASSSSPLSPAAILRESVEGGSGLPSSSSSSSSSRGPVLVSRE